MAAALRLATVDKGHDPRDFTLVVLGGAGPLHACAIADAAGIGRVVVPPRPGLGSARGLLVTDLKLEAVRSWPALLAAAPLDEAGRILDGLAAELRTELAAQGLTDPARVEVVRLLDLRYLGQSHELRVPWRDGGEDAAALAERFHALHRQVYGFHVPGEPVEVVALRATALGRVLRPEEPRLAAAGGPPPQAGVRPLLADDPARPVAAAVYDRADLLWGHRLMGPALIHEPDATTYLPPGWRAAVDVRGDLLLERVS
jgi:N-methylhydantoinase A